MAESNPNEYELSDTPQDGISCVKFGPSASLLLVSGWDKTTRLYDAATNEMRSKFTADAPQLACCFAGETTAASSGLDCAVKTYDLNTEKTQVLGRHDAGVRCLAYSDSSADAQVQGLLFSGGWDKRVCVWDPRQQQAVATCDQPDKVYAMALRGNNLVVGTAGRHVWIWDIRNTASVAQRRESSLKYQTRCIAAMPDAEGYVIGSIEGRVALEYIDPSPASQKRKFAFKCHRQKIDGVDTIYPVNTIAFHPTYETFATGGADGIVNIWDGKHRKRLYQFHRFPTSISSLDFSCDGSLLAVAASYTYEEGEKDHPPDSITIRAITEAEAKPKNA